MIFNGAQMNGRLLLAVAALNTLGLACFFATTHPHDPASAQHLTVADSAYMLDSVGFTLMLPGIFFSAIAFLCARAFVWNEETARAVWYASGFCINLFIAWRVGALLAAART
jgi:CBS-domain-containing membrane protein